MHRVASIVPRVARASALLLLGLATIASAACGGPPAAGAPGAAGEAAPSDAASEVDAGADAAPAPRPFAGSALEATQFIEAALEKRSLEVQACVREYRARKNLPHARVEISVGIDQEGRLMGATLKRAAHDQVFSDCAQRALADAPFPRSHAGVITMTKSYEEIVQ